MLHISVALATLKKYVAAQGKLQLVSRVSTNVRCLVFLEDDNRQSGMNQSHDATI